uniref:Phosphatidic acid phosphatase type 2/haloperoxidase domain-containing protein n=1 Tax=Mesocestoides corti TaxID=53468 RepID=A0A5K3FEB0_MESCO
MKKIGATEQASLTNHNPEPNHRRSSTESTALATPLFIYCSSFVSFSGWLHIFLGCHWIAD